MPSESIDLAYLDPPFNKRRVFTASSGSQAEGAVFRDFFRAEMIEDEYFDLIRRHHPLLYRYLESIRSLGHNSNYFYLYYMGVRLLEIHRVLRQSGSLYLHCDAGVSAYLKLLLDYIFGAEHFRSEIIWWYRKFGRGDRNFKKNHDTILYYAKDAKQVFFQPLFEEFSPRTQKDKYKRVLRAGRWIQDKCTPMQSVRKSKGVALSNTWEIPFLHSQSKERLGYPTQKPLALLDRIIQASTRVGDFVLDPFCGCATTCISAERLDRQWMGIDVAPQSFELLQLRLQKEATASKKVISQCILLR